MIQQKIPVKLIDADPLPEIPEKFVKIFGFQVKAGSAKPISVRKIGNRYILLDGKRRVAAARKLELTEILADVEIISPVMIGRMPRRENRFSLREGR